MAESNGNGRTTTARAEYEAATKDLRFSKDFFPALEAVINDPLERIGTRVLAWYKRHSWGNFSLYAVNDDGSDAQQSNCASDLCVTKQRVCQAISYLEKRGYLYRDGKKVYVSLSPVVGPKPQKVARSADFSAFLEEWKVAHSADFQELEVARAAVERIRKVILSGYRESRRARTNGALHIKEEITESTEERGEREETPPPPSPPPSSQSVRTNGHSTAVTVVPKPDPEVLGRFEQWRMIRNECPKPVPDENLELRRQCFEVFASYSPPEQETIIVDTAARVPFWQKDKLQFIPNALKYLRERIWRSDPVQNPALQQAAEKERKFRERVARLDAVRGTL